MNKYTKEFFIVSPRITKRLELGVSTAVWVWIWNCLPHECWHWVFLWLVEFLLFITWWTQLSAPSLYGIFPYAGLKFYFYEEMKRHVPEEQKKNIMVKLACGSVAGLLGQTFTYPLDVVRRQMQVMYFRVQAPWNYISIFSIMIVTDGSHLNRFNRSCHQTV